MKDYRTTLEHNYVCVVSSKETGVLGVFALYTYAKRFIEDLQAEGRTLTETGEQIHFEIQDFEVGVPGVRHTYKK